MLSTWNDVAVIDGATNAETATIDTRCSALRGGIAYDSVTGDVYATLTFANSCDGIQVISGTTQTGTLDQGKVDNKVVAVATATDPKAGTPTPRLTEKGKLPSGVTFTAGKNGTATITGKPAHSAKGKSYVITLTASNGVGKAVTQKFTLKVS
jgi:DNA-binding beta-propeller fold protein YncE